MKILVAILLSAATLAAQNRQCFPETLATGTGDEATAWQHADGTGGIQTCANSLIANRGGRIGIAPGRFDVTQPIRIFGAAVSVVGVSAGYPSDPNARGDGSYGSKIVSTGTAFQL